MNPTPINGVRVPGSTNKVNPHRLMNLSYTDHTSTMKPVGGSKHQHKGQQNIGRQNNGHKNT